MKNWSCILIPFLLLIFGCEKVIDVDLNEASPEVVIEGNLSYSEKELEVKISKTGSYFDTEPIKKINNAEVFLINSEGERLKANKAGEGLYKLNKLLLKPGEEYQLIVNVDDEEYSATSTLNSAVKIDSLGYNYYNEGRFFEKGYRLFLYFWDTPEVANYYRIKLYKNGKFLNNINDLIVFDDSNLNGKSIQIRLRGQAFQEGDTARVEMLSIDENTWEYFSTLRDLGNINPGTLAPANPASGFTNGALGYFSAWSHDSKTKIIQK